MKLKTYTQFIGESQLTSIKAGEDSKVNVSDQKTADGKVVPAQEILGQIIAADTEDSFKAYFYDKYGSTKFDTATMGQMTATYQDYYKEKVGTDAEKEKEEKKKEKEGGDEGGGDDPLADLGI
tara:strand:+ start:178 stop:546 length:369 start_codon:yes stop_codon:yes gene_type:complete